MQSTIDTYRQAVSNQPQCKDPWFSDALTRARTGEQDAGRRICGSCLRVALQAAENRWDQNNEVDLFVLVEEANAALIRALSSFEGAGADQFLQYVEQRITQQLSDSPL